jgi:hypothetical protein
VVRLKPRHGGTNDADRSERVSLNFRCGGDVVCAVVRSTEQHLIGD